MWGHVRARASGANTWRAWGVALAGAVSSLGCTSAGDGRPAFDSPQPHEGAAPAVVSPTGVEAGASESDAGETGAEHASVDVSSDASTMVADVKLDASDSFTVVCPVDDVSCSTGGYAHFTIPNPASSGLDNAARYEVFDEVVVEQVSGLVWERSPSAEYSGWQEAKQRCAELAIAGRDDFRLPGRIELVTILDFEQLPVAASVFDGIVAEYYWTSSPASFVDGSAYSVYLGAGETTIANASPGRALSWCVAGEFEVTVPQFEVDEAVVFDRGSGLTWERALAPAVSWQQADERCSELGMRLPSVAELQSIVDERAHDPAIDLEIFPGEFPDATLRDNWTASARGQQWWTVDFTDGKTYADRLPSEELASRCVR